MATDASADPLLREIRALKAKYASCKAVHDVGSYRCILDVPFKTHGTTVKFQIEDGYPSSVPDILVKSTRLPVEQRAKLEEALRDFCRSHAEPADATDGSRTTVLLKLADYADVWLHANCVDYSGLADGVDGHAAEEQECEAERSGDRPARPRGKNGPRGGGKARTADRSDRTSATAAVPGGKKPPMRTAEDVIKRITWDKSLSPERFAVGYVDRFVGVIEKPFTDFSWESLVDADRGTLAVPQHRIAYFKYDGVTVWDKSTRLDNVFGSIGGTTIADVVAAAAAGPVVAAAQQPASDGNGCSESTDAAASDDESSAEAVNAATTTAAGYNLTVAPLAAAAAAESESSPTTAAAVEKPNYFVCLRVTSPDAVARVAALQADLLLRRPELASYMLPPSRLHVTLAVLRLPVRSTAVGRRVGDDEAERTALQALRRAADAWTHGPVRLDVAGLAQFGRRVLYGRVRPSEDLDTAAAAVRRSLVDSGVDVLDEPFVPHMTIVKLPVTAARGRGRRGGLCIDASDVASGDAVTGMPFGDDRVASMHLCSFLKDQIDPAEFYNSMAVELPLPLTSNGGSSSLSETQGSWGDETDSAW